MCICEVDTGLKELEDKVAEARYVLRDYCVSPSHYRYHKGLKGIAYRIPLNLVDGELSDAILMLLLSRKVAMGVVDGMYVLYQNNNDSILTFTKQLGYQWFYNNIEKCWNSMFDGTKSFCDIISLTRYYEEDGVADALDFLLKSFSTKEKGTLALVMLDPNYFTIRELSEKLIDI